MTSHSKGPWKRDRFGELRDSGGDGSRVDFRGVSNLCAGSSESMTRAEANTALMQASPVLLESLQKLIEVASGSVELSDWPELQEALEQGRLAESQALREAE